MKTGQFIRDARQRADMTQVQLSAATGIAQSTLSAIEKGRQAASDSHVPRICRALNLDIGDVFALQAEDKTAAALAQMTDDGGCDE